MVTSDCRSKAVSDGIIIWQATSIVIARACRFPYGNIIQPVYDSENKEHKERPILKGIDGVDRVDGVWNSIIERVSWGATNK